MQGDPRKAHKQAEGRVEGLVQEESSDLYGCRALCALLNSSACHALPTPETRPMWKFRLLAISGSITAAKNARAALGSPRWVREVFSQGLQGSLELPPIPLQYVSHSHASNDKLVSLQPEQWEATELKGHTNINIRLPKLMALGRLRNLLLILYMVLSEG